MNRTAKARILVVLMVLLATFGCARSPEVQLARYLAHGDAYFKQARYREAVIEYRNVLRIDPSNRRAVAQLGLSHYHVGELTQAARYLMKSEELDPENLDVRVKLGTIYVLGRQPAEARRRASLILAKDPRNLDGLLLFAQSANTPEEVRAAIQRLEDARNDFDQRAALHLALGVLYLRNQGQAAAERAFREAVEREPTSVQAHTALGNFYRGLNDNDRAEREFKLAAADAPATSAAPIHLANFYLNTGKSDEAKRVLREATKKTPDYLPAWRRLAEVALAEGRYEESLKGLETVLKKNPSDLVGHFIKGRVYLAKHEPTRAIQEFQTVLKTEPGFVQARYQLALADLENGNVEQAKMELKEAAKTTPSFLEARLLLSSLYVQTGAFPAAITELDAVLAQQPTSIQAHVLLGAAYLAKREPARATEVFQKLAALAPREPQGPYLVGLGLLADGKRSEAQKEFERALALRPDYFEPLAQLVAMDVGDKRADVAGERIKKQIALAPTSAALESLLGGVYRAQGQMGLAETAYRKAIDLDSRQVGPYLALGQFYAASGKYEAALANFNAALKLRPKDPVTLMLVAVLHDKHGDLVEAQHAYEEVLKLNPRFAPAANNLAYLYARTKKDKERALYLARIAKEAAPDDPYVSDTLAWILYERGIYQEALNLLKQSAAKIPDDPEIQYHLGMVSYKMGDRHTARTALTQAANSLKNFDGKDEARRILATF